MISEIAKLNALALLLYRENPSYTNYDGIYLSGVRVCSLGPCESHLWHVSPDSVTDWVPLYAAPSVSCVSIHSEISSDWAIKNCQFTAKLQGWEKNVSYVFKVAAFLSSSKHVLNDNSRLFHRQISWKSLKNLNLINLTCKQITWIRWSFCKIFYVILIGSF